MKILSRIPAPPPIARRWVRAMLGLGVGVALGLTPLLGQADIPGFKALISLYPDSLRDWLIPLTSLLMGGMAAAIQFYGEERTHRAMLRRLFPRVLLGLLVALVAFIVLHSWVVVTVGDRSLVRGFGARNEGCGQCEPPGSSCPQPCTPAMEDDVCVKMVLQVQDRVDECWSEGARSTAEVLLTLSHLVLMGGLGTLVGLIVLRGERARRATVHRGARRHRKPATRHPAHPAPAREKTELSARAHAPAHAAKPPAHGKKLPAEPKHASPAGKRQRRRKPKSLRR